jgi:hypothetical protein
MSIDSTRILQRATELEQEIQAVAFDMLREEGAYERAQQLLVVASDVSKLSGRLTEVLSGKPRQATETSERPARRAAKARRQSASKYPVFFIAGDKLVKIGKGKQKTAKEYRHEATRSSFDTVARWIETTTLSGSREWSARAADDELAGQVPAYQIYLVISALQAVGVVAAVRRGQYELTTDSGEANEWWSALASLPVPDAGAGDE